MHPVMLVFGSRLTLIVVVLSLEALLSVVSSARSPASATSGSDSLDAHTTKSSRRNLTQPSSDNQDKHSAMSSTSGRTDVPGGSRRRKGNTTASVLPSDSHSGRDSSVPSQGNFGEDTHFSSGTEDIQVGCRELRARSYITDGFCTSEKPVQEVVCAGYCLPIMDMPWYAEFVKTLAKTKLKDWQCVEDVVRKKRVKLLCKDGSSRHYRIKVVKSCKCKKITNKHNKTTHKKKRKRPDEKAKTNIVS